MNSINKEKIEIEVKTLLSDLRKEKDAEKIVFLIGKISTKSSGFRNYIRVGKEKNLTIRDFNKNPLLETKRVLGGKYYFLSNISKIELNRIYGISQKIGRLIPTIKNLNLLKDLKGLNINSIDITEFKDNGVKTPLSKIKEAI